MNSKPEKSADSVVVFEEDTSGIFSVIKRFFKKIVTVSTIYLIGYFDLSIAWLIAPVMLSVLREEWKKTSDRKRQSAKLAVQNEKKVILAQLGDLPSWVYFPDMERTEWLNKMLLQLWPNINLYAQGMIKSTVEPKIQETLEMYKVSGFQFGKLRLGTISPRIGGMKVYDKLNRNEIMMDLDLNYAGDCDISFYLKGLSGGIKDFQIHGIMRIIMKPLLPSVPFVGGVQVFFLNKPTIDFNLVGAIDVLDIPGISDILRKVIVEQISAMMVLPNKLPIVISDVVPADVIKTPEPEGVLRVQVVQGTNLMKMDVGVLGKGKSDPYIIVSMGAQEFRSQTIDNNLNPKWDYWCEAIVTIPHLEELKFEVWDWDPGFPGTENDDFLGRASFKLNTVLENGEVDTWISLEEVKHGMVHLRLSWYELSDVAADLKPAMQELEHLCAPNISSSLLILYLDSLQHLPDAKANKRPDPIVSITAGHETKTTGVQYRTNCPVYEQGFTFLIHNPATDSFVINVTDQKTGLELGSFLYPLNKLLEKDNLKLDAEPFTLLKSGSNSKIVFSAQLKILKKSAKKEQNLPFSAIPDAPATSPASPQINGTLQKQLSSDKTDGVPASNDQSVDSNVQAVEEEELVAEARKAGETCEPTSTSDGLQKQNSLMGSIKGSIRRRRTSHSETKSLGSIELTLNFIPARQKLIVTIHRIVDLPIKDSTDLPDPYVKLYILPKSKDTKRKTKVIKDSANPVFEEAFEYVMSKDEIPYRQLKVIVTSQKTSFVSRSAEMGQVTIELKEVSLDNTKAWFNFEPETE